MMFECDKCGQCCRNLLLSSEYQDLDRGDRICKYLEGNLCGIYSERPLKCRIDECYELLFSAIMTKDEYYGLTYKFCDILKKMEDK